MNDIYALFACIIDKNINERSFEEFKNILIRAKYRLSFIYPNIEEYLLKENFNMPETIYTSSDLLENFLTLKNPSFKTLRANTAEELLINTINNLLLIEDVQYICSETSFACYLKSLYIRAILQFISNEDRELLNKTYDEVINCFDFNSSIYKKSIDLITNAFESKTIDQARLVRIVLNV